MTLCSACIIMKKLNVIVSLPGENTYLHDQIAGAKAVAERCNVELRVLNAMSDPVTQSQQLLDAIQSSDSRPDAILVEPVTTSGLPRVAEAAVAAGVGWVINNARVDYMAALRQKAKAPVFAVTQDHKEIGNMQGRQFAALLPGGGSVLYMRGPGSNFLAIQRAEGIVSSVPANISAKTLKVQWTAESAYESVASWLRLASVRAADTVLIAAQDTDFVLAARRAFQDCAEGTERTQWLALPCAGVGVASRSKPLVDNGILAAVVVTSLTMDTALEMLVHAVETGSQPPEETFVAASFYPSLEKLTKR
jgi:ABC-type sugar transport system substrate-binding protein